MSEERFTSALQDLVDNAIIGGNWVKALTSVERAMGVRGVLIHGYERFGGGAHHFFEASANLCSEMISDYQAFAAIDVRIERALALASGAFVCDHDYSDFRSIDRTPIYAEVYRRYDLGRFMGVRLGSAPGADRRHLFLTLLRPNAAEEPTTDEVRRTLALSRMMQSVMLTLAAFSALRNENVAKSIALDRVLFGCVFLEHAARIREANLVAQSVIDRSDAFDVRQGRLVAHNAEVQALILQACDPRAKAPRVSITSIQRTQGRRYVALVIKLSGDVRSWLSDIGAVTAMLFVVDPDITPVPQHALWQAAFDLTPSEAAVASLIMEGHSEREIAEARCVAFSTVHSQIKGIFAKLDVRTRAQATKLISRTSSFFAGE